MFKLFVYERYYPAGGVNDYVGEFDSIREAIVCFIDMAKDDPYFDRKCQVTDADLNILVRKKIDVNWNFPGRMHKSYVVRSMKQDENLIKHNENMKRYANMSDDEFAAEFI